MKLFHKVCFLILLSNKPDIVYYIFCWLCDELLSFLYCKLLWIKVSAKYIKW